MRWALAGLLWAAPLAAQWQDTRPPGCVSTVFGVAGQAKRALLWWPGQVRSVYAPWYAVWYRDPEGVLLLVDLPSRIYVQGTRTGPVQVLQAADTSSVPVDTSSVRVRVTFDGTVTPCPDPTREG